jgi:dTDP-glucose 4,6-dehydratase
MKILVLGISSFAGSSFFEYVSKIKKYEVYGSYNTRKKNYYMPFLNKLNKKKIFKVKMNSNSKIFDIVKKLNPHYIIDFSSLCMVNESWNNFSKYIEFNISAKIKLIENIKKIKNIKKYIYISTPEIFGSNNFEIHEKYLVKNPTTPYATSKLAFENLLTNYSKIQKYPFIIARFSNFYGRRQPLYRLIPKVIFSIILKIKFPLHGNGHTKRDFIFEDDFNSGILKIIKKGLIGKIYHFSTGEFIAIKNLIKKICIKNNVNYKNLVIKTKDRNGKDQNYFLCSKKTRKELMWQPKVNLDKGIDIVQKFMLSNIISLETVDLEYKYKILKS